MSLWRTAEQADAIGSLIDCRPHELEPMGCTLRRGGKRRVWTQPISFRWNSGEDGCQRKLANDGRFGCFHLMFFSLLMVAIVS
jgi:hypothetical protein